MAPSISVPASFTIDLPVSNQVFYKQSIGGTMQIEVKGKFQNSEDHIGRQAMYETVKGISVRLGSDISVAAKLDIPLAQPHTSPPPGSNATLTDGTWSATLNASAGVNQEITVTAAIYHREAGQQSFDKMFDIPKTLVISVQEDNKAPTLVVTGPTPSPGAAFFVDIDVTASDAGSGLQSLDWSLDGSPFTAIAPITNEREFKFTAHIPLASRTATYQWVLRATDRAGNSSSLPLSLKDNAAPELTISYPSDGVKVPHDGRSAQVELQGKAPDPWSGVKSVEWSLDGGRQSIPVLTTDGWATWTARVDFGPNEAGRSHQIAVRAIDNVGHSAVKFLNLEVARPYRPRDAKTLSAPGPTSRTYWSFPKLASGRGPTTQPCGPPI